MIVLPMWPSVSPTGHHQIVHVLGENGADSVNRVVSIEPFALGFFASASNARRQFRLGLWPKDKGWRHAPPASLRRTSGAPPPKGWLSRGSRCVPPAVGPVPPLARGSARARPRARRR